jgi:branched-chain amino acid transport system ATP-binding protein
VSPEEPVLQAHRVSKRFGGVEALKGVSLDIPRGTIFGLIGPNGAGKTTLFNLLTGFLRPDEGELRFRGRRYDGLSPEKVARMGLARTFQNIRLFQNMTALENVLVGMHRHLTSGVGSILLGGRPFRQEEREAEARALELLELVGLRDKADLLARHLPYGDQRRLEIARALASRPEVLLLDEPSAGMLPREREELARLLMLIRDRYRLTMVLIEHQMALVMAVCQRVAVLHYGAKIAEGEPREIRENPAVIEAYLGGALPA